MICADVAQVKLWVNKVETNPLFSGMIKRKRGIFGISRKECEENRL